MPRAVENNGQVSAGPAANVTAAAARRIWAFLVRESGLFSVRRAGLDAVLVIFCRTSRMFAYGASSMVLALFLSELRQPDERIGLFMTLTLAGDVALSLLLTVAADRVVGRRRVLLAGALLMVASGVAFALLEGYWVLLLAAVAGVLSATGQDAGPFRAVEESVLSELTVPETRSDVLVWYVTSASLGSALGFELAGRLVEELKGREGWSLLDAYHAVFWLYAAMGIVSAVASLLLSQRCELGGKGPEAAALEMDDEDDDAASSSSSTSTSSQRSSARKRAPAPPGKIRLPGGIGISPDTLQIVSALWLLLMMDSFADGMANNSLTSYFLDATFHPSKSALGDLLSTGFLLGTAGNLLAGPLARHIGLVNTMVFTHIPSSAAVLLFPFPSTLALAAALLLLRLALNGMDQAPRAALIAAVVRPEERTTVMGVTTTLRTLASMLGPGLSGLLAGRDRFWVAFVVAGALRLTYDVGLWIMFVNVRLYRHERGAGTAAEGGGHAYETVAGAAEDESVGDDVIGQM